MMRQPAGGRGVGPSPVYAAKLGASMRATSVNRPGLGRSTDARSHPSYDKLQGIPRRRAHSMPDHFSVEFAFDESA